MKRKTRHRSLQHQRQMSTATRREPCGAPPPERSRLDPLREGARPFGLALSGGGARATLAGLGVVRFLADIDRLEDLRHVTAVSGGSIAAGIVACKWDELRSASFTADAVDALVIEPALAVLTRRSLQRELFARSWRTIQPQVSRTVILADRLDEAFFDRMQLRDLPRGTWFEINAANLTTATRFRFTQDLVGDYITGSIPTVNVGVRVADAVAWSCAVPGLFNTTLLDRLDLPCQSSAGTPELVDGGVYDNLGVDAFKNRSELPALYCVVCNAGGSFDPAPSLRRIPLVGDLLRANNVLYQQVASVRSRRLFDEFTSDVGSSLDGCLFNLRSRPPEPTSLADSEVLAEFLEQNRSEPDGALDELAAYPTTLARVPPEVAHRLIYRGWWLAGSTVCAYAPDLVRVPPIYTGPE